ncbi:MAG: acyltransferase, partial [Clostridia bacterium]|nr:acyltransferase [Clostridia bacterium]
MQIKKTERESGIELLRIFAMLLIIAHHLVNNSGISHLYDYAHPSWRMFCLLVWGMWGKTAINA